jgi:hypothetical protein
MSWEVTIKPGRIVYIRELLTGPKQTAQQLNGQSIRVFGRCDGPSTRSLCFVLTASLPAAVAV